MTYNLPALRTHCLRFGVLFVFLVRYFSSQAVAQDDYKPKFGFIDREALEMTAAPGDSTAEAVVLYDYGSLRFSHSETKGLTMRIDCWIRVKILKESALGRASVALTYYDGSDFSKKERLQGLKAFTYNLEDNQIVTSKLESKTVKDERSSADYRTTKFNLPNVKKGSVIEYFYTRETPLSLRNEPETWRFQGDIPVNWSEYRIAIPYFLEYKMTFGGYLPLSINQQEDREIDVGPAAYKGRGIDYRFVVKDAPPFLDEPYITTEMDYLSKIRFELASVNIPGQGTRRFSQTWEQVDRTLESASWFGGEIRKTSYLKAVKDEILKTATEPGEKMKMAYAHFQQYMKWDGNFGIGSRDGPKKAYDNRKGNASDINLALIALLRDMDLECNPVVLSTRSHGRVIQEIPMMESFNYVIGHVKIGETEYLLDATQPYARPGLIPEYALNEVGRLMPKRGAGKFIDLTTKEPKSKLEIIQAEIDPEGGLVKGTYSISYGGYEALQWRNKYAAGAASVYEGDLKKTLQEWQLQNIQVKNQHEDLTSTVNVSCDFEVEDANLQVAGFYFNPVMAGRWSSNPLKSKERIYPLDFASGFSDSYMGSFKLPASYMLEDVSAPEVLVLPGNAGRFAYQVKQVDDMIQVSSSVKLTKTNFTAEEYHYVREFFERVVQRHAKPLVIKRKDS